MVGVTEQDDRMTIGVFARTAKVSTSALGFYDDCGFVRPHAVDPITGYRYYSPNQHAWQVRVLQPSLHLNLADDHRRLGDPARAREHLAQAGAWFRASPTTSTAA